MVSPPARFALFHNTTPCEESEIAYLIDPIDETDVALLAFDEEGKAVPVPGISAWDLQRVDETIRRLKLNEHEPLSEARRTVWQKVHLLIEDYKHAKARCHMGGNPSAKQRMKHACEGVRNMTKQAEELSAVPRWCVLLRNDPQLSRLIG
jgi:hypothetical protein